MQRLVRVCQRMVYMVTNPSPSTQPQIAPDLKEYLDRRMRDVFSRVNCIGLGTIVSFDATKQTASINIVFKRVLKSVNPLPGVAQNSDQVISYPPLLNVPVIVLGGGAAHLTFPITAGDSCLLLIVDKDMDTWFETGQVTTPPTERNHDLSDAIALVGINNLQNPIANYNTILASLIDITGERLTQAGFLQPYAGSSAPSGWLLCYGQSVSRTTYAVLFAIIGTTYGSVDGTHFNLPDLRGRVPVGLDNMGGSSANVLTNTFNPNRNTLGGSIGQESHQLIIAEIPSHHHTAQLWRASGADHDFPSGSFTDAPNSNMTTNDTGGDGAHQNVQPGMMFNWIIKI